MRIRSIKPEFWRSSDISALEIEDRLLFVALWSYVDDNGVGLDKLSSITADLFADDLEKDPQETFARVSRGLLNLSEAGRIFRYEVSGKEYLEVANWGRHQRIDKPNKPRFPSHATNEAVIRESVARVAEKVAPGTGEQGNRGTEEQRQVVVTLSDADAPDGDAEEFTWAEEELPLDDVDPTPGYPADFTAFWDTYPRRHGKGAACTAFVKAKQRASVETIIAGAARMRDDPNLPLDRSLIAHPSTWLNQGRWEDDPLPPRGGPSASDRRLMQNYEVVQRAVAREAPVNPFQKEIAQ